MEHFENFNMSHINIPEDASTEELKNLLSKTRTDREKMAEQVEQLKIRNELEMEAMKAQQWEEAMNRLKEAKEAMARAHQAEMEEIKKLSSHASSRSGAHEWLKTQLGITSQPNTKEEEIRLQEERRREEEKQKALTELRKQQADIQAKIDEIAGTSSPRDNEPKAGDSQASLLEQLKVAIGIRKEEDPNRALLKALANNQHRVTDTSGANTLKADMLERILQGNNSMAEWLANLNKQEEGELNLGQSNFRCGESEESDCRHNKTKSGMLDRATTTVTHKQVWPQKNLGEDWAEEQVEFKNLRFEHLVAGETRTIETCTEPAQILGRLKLLRRIAYLKLRGYEWSLLRKMYVAILSSIETRENSWDSNFDHFETILYRRVMADHKGFSDSKGNEGGRKSTAGTITGQKGDPGTAPIQYGWGQDPMQPRRWCTMYVQPA